MFYEIERKHCVDIVDGGFAMANNSLGYLFSRMFH